MQTLNKIKNIIVECMLDLTESSASEEAKKKGLVHSGFGKYKDKSGNTVAQIKNGKLVPVKGTKQASGTKNTGKVQKFTGTQVKPQLSKLGYAEPHEQFNNVKVGDVVIRQSGEKYLRKDDNTFVNMSNPNDTKTVERMSLETLKDPVSFALDKNTKQKKQLTKFDIAKNQEKEKLHQIAQQHNTDDVISISGKKYVIEPGWGKEKIVQPISDFELKWIEAEKKKPIEIKEY